MIRMAYIDDIKKDDLNKSITLDVRILPTNEFTLVDYPYTKSTQCPSRGSFILIYQPNDFKSYYLTTLRDPDVIHDDLNINSTPLLNNKDLLEEGEQIFKAGDLTSNYSYLLIKKNLISSLVSGDKGSTQFHLDSLNTLIKTNVLGFQSSSIIGIVNETPLSIGNIDDNTPRGINFSYTFGPQIVKSDFIINKDGIKIELNTPTGKGNITLTATDCSITFNNTKITMNMNGKVTIEAPQVELNASSINVSASQINLGKNGKRLLTEDFLEKFNSHTHSISEATALKITLPVEASEVSTKITKAG
jgi:hypothetical protein